MLGFNALSEAPLSTLPDAGGGTSVTVTPGVGSLVLTGFAPTVSATQSQTVTPGVGSLTLTGFAPDVSAGTNATASPGAGSLTLTGLAPTVSATSNVTVTPGFQALTLTGFAPAVSATQSRTVSPGTGTLTLVGFAPVVSTAAPSENDVRLYSVPSDANPNDVRLFNVGGVSVGVIPGFGSLVLTGRAPTVSASSAVSLGVGSLALTGRAPTVTATQSQTLLPGVGTLVLQGYAPTVTVPTSVTVSPGVGSLIILGHSPSVSTITGGGGASARGRISPAHEWELELVQAARLAAITKELAQSDNRQARRIAKKLADYTGDIRQAESLQRELAKLEAAQREQVSRTKNEIDRDADLRAVAQELNEILQDEADAINAIIAFEEYEARFLLSALGLKIQ